MEKYQKTDNDKKREESDLKNNPIMRWLENQDAFKFNVGDIVIKKTKTYTWNIHSSHPSHHDTKWVTETSNKTTSAPKKYMYVFENKLGIGYLRQLKADGTGCGNTLICVANFDPETTKLELDPDFVDHTLLGEGDFAYNNEHVIKKKFRQEAIVANKKIMVRTSSTKALKSWFLGLKVGDTFWYGDTFDNFATTKWEVVSTKSSNRPPYHTISDDERILGGSEWRAIDLKVVEQGGDSSWRTGSLKTIQVSEMSWAKVSMIKPHPMKDPLSGDHPK